MTQLNTPYPATAYLTGFLRQHEARLGLEVSQADAALELFLRVFSRAGIQRVLDELTARAAEFAGDDDDGDDGGGDGGDDGDGADDAEASDGDDNSAMPPSIAWFLAHGERYVDTIDAVVRFLQGRDPAFALRIVSRELLPEGPRFQAIEQGPGADDDDPLGWAFGGLGITDRAKHLASLYIDDLADVVRDGIQPEFELARYGERLAASTPTFDPLHGALEGEPTLVDAMLDELAAELYARQRPDLVGLTAPFPGNVYGAFRIARAIKAIAPATRIVLGGGYVNTELRELADPRVFGYVDFVTLDDGEAPMLALIEHVRDPHAPLHRTFVCRDGTVEL